MAYEFKKLSAVEAVETPADTAHVLIEEDGVIKRIPKSKVGGVKVASTAKVGQTLAVKAIDENGMPIEWECADAGTQSDWNEFDETSMAYVKNKPFYKKMSLFIEEQTLNPDDYYYYDWVNSYNVGLIEFNEFVEGQRYGVYWDGKLYDLTGSYLSYWSCNYWYIGNGSMFSPEKLSDTHEPFAIVKERDEYGDYSYYLRTNDNNPHTVSVYEMELTKIESIFIPDEAFAQPDWEETDKDLTSYIKNKPFGNDKLIIVEEQAVTLDNYSNTPSFLVDSVAQTGEKYQITFDGVNYVGTLSQWETDYGFNFTLQNGSNATFCIWNIGGNKSKCNISIDSSSLNNTTHTIKVICLDKIGIKKIDKKFLPDIVVNGDKEMILTSSTEGSTKRFKITVDDSGNLTATEVIE